MDFERKPGARDGRPNKGRRNKPRVPSDKKAVVTKMTPEQATHDLQIQSTWSHSSFQTQPKGSAEPDEDGFVPGVSYSLHKQKRWELVENKKKKKKNVLVKEFPRQLYSPDEARTEIKHDLDKRRTETGKGNVAGEEKDEKVIQTRKGPKKKTNQSNKSKKTEEYRAREKSKGPTEITEVIVVDRNLSEKEMRRHKESLGTSRCRCSYCVPPSPARTNKKSDIIKDAGL